ncbi:MAG: DNA polymerase II large subunit, partial [Candidatus Bathyarchaeia archaeon]
NWELKNAVTREFKGDLKEAAFALSIPAERLKDLLNDPFRNRPSGNEAINLSLKLKVPLHPTFTFFWSNLGTVEDLKRLRMWMLKSKIERDGEYVKRITGELDETVKRNLEAICLPHRITDRAIIIEGDDACVFAFCLGNKTADVEISGEETVLDAVKHLCGVTIKDKAPTFIGARMGRPEKAKRREMKPLVHVLFPVGLAGGAQRDIVEAAKHEKVFVEIVNFKCPRCKTHSLGIKCPICGFATIQELVCPKCGRNLNYGGNCPLCKVPAVAYGRRALNVKELLEDACKRLGSSAPKSLKGVKGLSNEAKIPEIIEKGILRAKYDLSVYKDGTVRFDATNAPLTHFRPAEIGVSLEKMLQLGYTHDLCGDPLTDVNQICELKTQDVIIPAKCAEYFIRVSKFIDELLVKVYGLQPYYNVKTYEDLVGHLIFGLAPHTSVGILGRIVGFTRLNICYAHPVWHSAKRRDCDGDEDALMLALDALLNFSRKYLPAQIGGIMDAPLLLIPTVNPCEVQRQAHDFDVAGAYPAEFYEKTFEKVEAKRVSQLIDLIEHRLGTEAQFEGFRFTVPVSDINMGVEESVYKRFKAMIEKLNGQLTLAEKIEAVDAKKVALKVLTKHFIRDIAGNLRAFSTQGFRCKTCNKRFRRLPLRGKCTQCGGELSLTVYRGGIEKYLEAAENIIRRYRLPKYYAQRVALVREEINSLFEGKKPKQISLADFA